MHANLSFPRSYVEGLDDIDELLRGLEKDEDEYLLADGAEDEDDESLDALVGGAAEEGGWF